MSNNILLSVIEKGNPQSKNKFVFISGFPDSEVSGWGNLIDLLCQNSSNDCYCLAMCLPGYEKNGYMKLKRWGYTFNELVDLIHSTICHYIPQYNEIQVHLVIHDWGALLGLLYENKYPQRISQIIDFDVGIMKRPTGKSLRIVIFYQLWFAIGYILSQVFHRLIGDLFIVLYVLFPDSCKPTRSFEKLGRPLTELSSVMGYPYFHLWYLMLTGAPLPKPQHPSCPILFMYGKYKNVMFHSDEFIQQIRKSPGSRYVEMDTGHWVASQEPEIAEREIRQFIQWK